MLDSWPLLQLVANWRSPLEELFMVSAKKSSSLGPDFGQQVAIGNQFELALSIQDGRGISIDRG